MSRFPDLHAQACAKLEAQEVQEAVPLLRQALQAAQEENSQWKGDAKVLECQCQLGKGLLDLQEVEEAIRVLSENLSLLKQSVGRKSETTLASMGALVRALGEAGRVCDAYEIGIQYLALRLHVSGKGHGDTHHAMTTMSELLSRLGRQHEAVALQRVCVQLAGEPAEQGSEPSPFQVALEQRELELGESANPVHVDPKVSWASVVVSNVPQPDSRELLVVIIPAAASSTGELTVNLTATPRCVGGNQVTASLKQQQETTWSTLHTLGGLTPDMEYQVSASVSYTGAGNAEPDGAGESSESKTVCVSIPHMAVFRTGQWQYSSESTQYLLQGLYEDMPPLLNPSMDLTDLCIQPPAKEPRLETVLAQENLQQMAQCFVDSMRQNCDGEISEELCAGVEAFSRSQMACSFRETLECRNENAARILLCTQEYNKFEDQKTELLARASELKEKIDSLDCRESDQLREAVETKKKLIFCLKEFYDLLSRSHETPECTNLRCPTVSMETLQRIFREIVSCVNSWYSNAIHILDRRADEVQRELNKCSEELDITRHCIPVVEKKIDMIGRLVGIFEEMEVLREEDRQADRSMPATSMVNNFRQRTQTWKNKSHKRENFLREREPQLETEKKKLEECVACLADVREKVFGPVAEFERAACDSNGPLLQNVEACFRFMEESQRLVAEQQEANLSRREGLLNAAAEEKEQVFADLSAHLKTAVFQKKRKLNRKEMHLRQLKAEAQQYIEEGEYELLEKVNNDLKEVEQEVASQKEELDLLLSIGRECGMSFEESSQFPIDSRNAALGSEEAQRYREKMERLSDEFLEATTAYAEEVSTLFAQAHASNNNVDLEAVQRELICPLSCELMVDPVTTIYGHTYERSFIELWLRDHNTDPITREPLAIENLSPSYSVRKLANMERERQRKNLEEGQTKEGDSN